MFTRPETPTLRSVPSAVSSGCSDRMELGRSTSWWRPLATASQGQDVGERPVADAQPRGGDRVR